MIQSGWRTRIGAWLQRVREIPVGVRLMSGTIGLFGAVFLLWSVFLLADGILEHISAP